MVPHDARDNDERGESDWEDAFETTDAGRKLEDHIRTAWERQEEEVEQRNKKKATKKQQG
jgi:hypothetical protein